MRAYAERCEPDKHAMGWSSALAAGLLVAISASTSAPAAITPASSCGDVVSYGLPNTEITTAQQNPAADGLPSHCEVIGRINPRTGLDGKPYAIGFRLRMPNDWNGRFYFQGGGGTDGSLPNSLGNGSPTGEPLVLPLGYAVISTDGGHDNTINNDPDAGGTAAFGLDPQARLDYGYNAVDQVTQKGKALVTAYYGRAPEYSYFDGCSNGGRQGMVASQRFPDYFDGIVAGAPGFNLPRAAVAEAWNEQALAPLATRTDVNGQPYLPDTFSDADLQLVRRAILAACDALDGLEDGIVANSRACRGGPVLQAVRELQCTGAKADDCLSEEQIEALEHVQAGPRNSRGQRLYASRPWDAGITAPGSWRSWLLGTPAQPEQPLVNNATSATRSGGALSLIFVTPPDPVPVDQLTAYILDFDFDRDAPRIYARSGVYDQSSMEFMSANSPDRTAFRQHGGKMILWHGLSDGVFSANDTIRWYNALNRREHGSAADFARLFLVPGMGHCSTGPATSSLSPFTALVNWVEHGVAPQSITATAPDGTPWPGRTRPLCAHPSYAQYTSSGNVEDAASFTCIGPDNTHADGVGGDQGPTQP
jgi:Tannase and feruloyl esterase